MSPELALVDPALAQHARAWLPDPGDTLVRVERLTRAHRIAASRAERVEVLGLPVRVVPSSPAPSLPRAGRTPGHRRSALLAGGLAAGALIAALLVGVRVDLDGSPAGADTAAIGEPPAVTAPKASPAASDPKSPATPRRHTRPSQGPPRPSARTTPPAPRRFAWAPVPGADGYHVEFFRGSSLVFSADTKRPQVSIPASWELRGRLQTLVAGEYRWYVWALRSGVRASGAVVQAKLIVPQR